MKDIVKKIKTWSRQNENRDAFMLLFACAVGCVAGFGAFLLKSLIRYISLGVHIATGHLRIEWLHANWWLLVLPLIGILIAVVWQKKVARANMVHSTRHIVEYLNSKNYCIPGRLMFNPIIACGITLGFGGSAGTEGPIAYAGAAVGSSFGRAMGLDNDMLRIMIGIGAGAGIAGIFKSPIAGVLFTLEVLKMNMGAVPVIGLIMSCVCASITCYAFTGTTLYMPFTQTGIPDVPNHWVILLGIFCGIYAAVYNSITFWMQKFFDTRKRKWTVWISGGAIAGIALLMFPSIYGEGYPIMTQLINGKLDGMFATGLIETSPDRINHFMLMLALLLMVKAFATVCSNSAGGVAGDFAPTLFVGALCGALFSLAAKVLFGVDIPLPLCALFAMSGSFAGIVHAPVMSIFLVTEMSGAFQYILPITLCSAASFLTVKILNTSSRYIETRYDYLEAINKKSRN